MHAALVRGLAMVAFFGLALGACQKNARAESGTTEVTPRTLSATFDRSHFAGDVAFRIPADLPTKQEPVPFELYLGLSPQTQTRMTVRALLDLRDVQKALPERLSGVVETSCKRDITLDLHDARTEEETLRAVGTVRVRFTRCRNRGTATEEPGATWFTQDIEAVAKASLQARDNCLVVDLEEIDLSPRGFVGGVSNVLGVTALAQEAVLRKGREVLAENPVCPTLPDGLDALSPHFAEASLVEIEEGGIGAAMLGSIDVSADTLLVLLARVHEEGLLEAGR